MTAPHSVSVIHTGAVGDTDLYAATVSVTERPYASAQSTRAFYRVPVSMWELPTARGDPAGPHQRARPGQRHSARPTARPCQCDSPVYALVRGFVENYLTAVTGLDRYVVAGSGLAPVGGYHSAIVTIAEPAIGRCPTTPGRARGCKVLATVVAQTAQFATVNMNLPADRREQRRHLDGRRHRPDPADRRIRPRSPLRRRTTDHTEDTMTDQIHVLAAGGLFTSGTDLAFATIGLPGRAGAGHRHGHRRSAPTPRRAPGRESPPRSAPSCSRC